MTPVETGQSKRIDGEMNFIFFFQKNFQLLKFIKWKWSSSDATVVHAGCGVICS